MQLEFGQSHIPLQLGNNMFPQSEPHNFVKHSSPCITQDSASGLWFFFGPFKSAYTQECDAFIVNHANQLITLRNVACLFKRAYERVATLDKAENSFRACGIYPLNPHVFSPEDFDPARVSFVPNISEKGTNGATAVLQGMRRRQNRQLQPMMLPL
jgi:hypothetical protein